MAATKKSKAPAPPKPEAREVGTTVHLSGPSELPLCPRLTNGQTTYADQIGNVIFGLHTSRLVFANENGTDLEPVAEVVIPTAALLNAALNIVGSLSEPAMIEETARRYADQLHLMKSVRAKK